MINATLLVPGCIRMKPHSLCSGLLVSAWKALNLWGTTTNQIKSEWIINRLSQNALNYALWPMCRCVVQTATHGTREWCLKWSESLREVDDRLAHVAEAERLCVAERLDGGETALTRFIRLPGAQEPVKRKKGWIQLHWWSRTIKSLFH